ncbi:hypothetical protein KUV57_11485 [Epibacterium sp. DP7N7-1]|nr:hypothetical protein [Epibacterium sp. DP7N7-1]
MRTKIFPSFFVYLFLWFGTVTVAAEPVSPLFKVATNKIANNYVSFSPDSALFAHTDAEGFLEIREISTGDIISRSPSPVNITSPVAWDPSERSLYIEGAMSDELLFWDGLRWQNQEIDDVRASSYAGGHSQLSVNGAYLANTGMNGKLSLIDLKSFELVTLPKKQSRAHAASWSPDGSFLAVGYDGLVVLYDANTFDIINEFSPIHSPVYDNALISNMKWAPSSQFLAIQTLYGSAYIIEAGEKQSNVIDLKYKEGFIHDLVWAAEQKTTWYQKLFPWKNDLAFLQVRKAQINESHDSDAEILVWYDADTSSEISEFDFLNHSTDYDAHLITMPVSDQGVFLSVTSPSETKEISISHLVRITKSGKEVRVELPERAIAVSISNDGRYIAIREMEARTPTISLWRISDLERSGA